MAVEDTIPHWTFGSLTLTVIGKLCAILGVWLCTTTMFNCRNLSKKIFVCMVCLIVGLSLHNDYHKQKDVFVSRATECGILSQLYSWISGTNCSTQIALQYLERKFDIQFNVIDFLVNFCVERFVHSVSTIATVLANCYDTVVGVSYLGKLWVLLSFQFVWLICWFVGFYIVWKLCLFACRTTFNLVTTAQSSPNRTNKLSVKTIAKLLNDAVPTVSKLVTNLHVTSKSVFAFFKTYNIRIPLKFQWILIVVYVFGSFYLSSLVRLAQVLFGFVFKVIQNDLTTNVVSGGTNETGAQNEENSVEKGAKCQASKPETSSSNESLKSPQNVYNIVIHKHYYYTKSHLRNRNKRRLKPYDKVCKTIQSKTPIAEQVE